MSETEAELKELLIRSLNENGIISRLQAQLRAAVFLALEKHNYNERMPPANEFIRSLHNNEDGLVLFSLFTEFLKHSQLESTLEVFTHEAELGKLSIIDRDDLTKLLNLDPQPDSPLLSTLVSTHLKRSAALRTDAGSSAKSSSSDNVQLLSYDPMQQQRNGHDDASDHSVMASSIKDHCRPGGSVHSDVTSPRADHHMAVNDSLSRKHEVEPSKMDYRLNGSPLCPASSPRGEDYQDDFASPATLISGRISNASDCHGESDKRSGSQSAVSIHLIESARSFTPVNSLSPRNGGESSRSTSRSGTPSIVRIYSQVSRRSTSNEESSDVDGDDDQISELLREYSIHEDSVDQTIDSDQSLGLDHVEPVQPLSNIPSASH